MNSFSLVHAPRNEDLKQRTIGFSQWNDFLSVQFRYSAHIYSMNTMKHHKYTECMVDLGFQHGCIRVGYGKCNVCIFVHCVQANGLCSHSASSNVNRNFQLMVFYSCSKGSELPCMHFIVVALLISLFKECRMSDFQETKKYSYSECCFYQLEKLSVAVLLCTSTISCGYFHTVDIHKL